MLISLAAAAAGADAGECGAAEAAGCHVLNRDEDARPRKTKGFGQG